MKKLLDRLAGNRRENPETPDSGYFSTMFLEREEETPRRHAEHGVHDPPVGHALAQIREQLAALGTLAAK